MDVICRACAAPCDNFKVPLFTKNSKYSEDFNFFISGHLKSGNSKDPLPKWLCESCLKHLHDAVSFLRIVIESHSKLIVDAEKDKSEPKNEEVAIFETASVEGLEFFDDSEVLDDEILPEVVKEKKKPVPTLFTCNHCSRTFTRKEKLKCHLRIHTNERPYKCDQCSQAFRQLNALKCHRRIHTGEKPFKCDWPGCMKSFSQNTILKTHRTLHEGKKVKCDQCDKMFSRPSYLIQHRREHTGERPYTCHLCAATYKQKSHLDHHLSMHSGIKFPCEVCGKSYSKKWSLKVHMYSHMVDSKMPYSCSHCERSFPLKSKLLAHMKIKHQEEPESTMEVEQVKTDHTVVQVLCVTNEQILWHKDATLE